MWLRRGGVLELQGVLALSVFADVESAVGAGKGPFVGLDRFRGGLLRDSLGGEIRMQDGASLGGLVNGPGGWIG